MSKLHEYVGTNPNLTKAVVCYFVKGDKILLGLRKKVSLGLGENLISGIGGKVGDIEGLENETFEEALHREVMEEVGVKIKKFQQVGEITFLFPNKPKWNQFVIAYIVSDWEGDFVETESIKPIEFNINEIPYSKMWADNKYWLPTVLDGKSIIAKFLYDEENKNIVENEIIVQ